MAKGELDDYYCVPLVWRFWYMWLGRHEIDTWELDDQDAEALNLVHAAFQRALKDRRDSEAGDA